ncbi:phospho-sugar mutase [Proteiniborus sp. MB09-C3]|uniref:phospho-sugar mutase n=1 Tax=Proteiniborus sp. MB09-C3 TaxID=3050072 RepID=UPI0025531B2F|nr:phospho-sugar mutase [Proteiniborus sp. MB09-C3]WIV12072.1 phospho-sugar mutase [Proteiniborus sp. MB09-C3]
MDFMDKYNLWLKSPDIDGEAKKELLGIKDNIAEIEDRFYKDLEFGTGGLRGKIGAGTNRMNKYTVSKATQGLAEFILGNGDLVKGNDDVILNEVKNFKTLRDAQDDKSCVIAYDSRHKSREFAKTSALVLAANGIKAYLFESLRPTPELSFAVRHLQANAGIVITASHNPAEYNGYKAYGADGGQMVPDVADKVIARVKDIKDFSDVKTMNEQEAFNKELIAIIGKEIDDIYIENVKTLSLRDDIDKNINIVYTPLHGTGNIPVRRVLEELGYKNVYVVKEQELPDSNFSTVSYPNPEDPKAFKLAIELGEKVKGDIILGTDPDCDRVGVVVKDDKGEYIVLNGNQTGALLLDYILSSRKDIPLNSVIIKTIVTSELGRVIANHYGVETIDTLTGFKYIGEKIKKFEQSGEYSFQFGYEESFGYLTGTFVREKDAVIASMLICEMAAYYKTKELNLHQALLQLYERFGYYIEELFSINLEGIEGKRKIDSIMDGFRKDFPKEIADLKIWRVNDYMAGSSKLCDNSPSTHVCHSERSEESILGLPKENVIKFIFEDNSWYALRPSGTEPKLKVYMSANGKSYDAAYNKLKAIEKEVKEKVNRIY